MVVETFYPLPLAPTGLILLIVELLGTAALQIGLPVAEARASDLLEDAFSLRTRPRAGFAAPLKL
jgi:hypothetical protein